MNREICASDVSPEIVQARDCVVAPPATGLLQVADENLKVQSWIVAHLDSIVPVFLQAKASADIAPEIVAGVVRLMRALFSEARASDAASTRLWCDLSFAQLAVKMGCDKTSIVKRFWPVAYAADLVLDGPMPAYIQRKRRRNRWDVLVPAARAAALVGTIPGEPLIGESIDGPVPDTRTGSETGGTMPPVDEKPGAPRHRFDSPNKKKKKNRAGGERGASALAGAEASLPPASGTGSHGNSFKTGGTTPPVVVQRSFDFEARMDAGQKETHRLFNSLFNRFDRLEEALRSALKGGKKPSGAAEKKPSRAPQANRYGAPMSNAVHVLDSQWSEAKQKVRSATPSERELLASTLTIEERQFYDRVGPENLRGLEMLARQLLRRPKIT